MFQSCFRMLHKRRKVRVFVWKGIQKNICVSYYSSAFIINPQPRRQSVCSQSILLRSNPVRKQDYKNNSCTQFAREVVGPIYNLYKKNANCLLENFSQTKPLWGCEMVTLRPPPLALLSIMLSEKGSR